MLLTDDEQFCVYFYVKSFLHIDRDYFKKNKLMNNIKTIHKK